MSAPYNPNLGRFMARNATGASIGDGNPYTPSAMDPGVWMYQQTGETNKGYYCSPAKQGYIFGFYASGTWITGGSGFNVSWNDPHCPQSIRCEFCNGVATCLDPYWEGCPPILTPTAPP